MKRLAHTLVLALALASSGPDSRIAAFPQTAQPSGDVVLEAIAAAAGMPALENADLPLGYREIRIRSEQILENSGSSPMLRLVESADEISGTLWLFRTLSLRPNNGPMPRENERCAPLGVRQVCVRPWNLGSDNWTQVAIRLDQLGAWTLSDPCKVTTTVTTNGDTFSIAGSATCGDCGLLSVQRLVGSTLSSFSCAGPRYKREGDGRQAKEIYDYFIGLSGAIPPEPIRIGR
jgi:hypothetical protein